jgi:hypothetical protein
MSIRFHDLEDASSRGKAARGDTLDDAGGQRVDNEVKEFILDKAGTLSLGKKTLLRRLSMLQISQDSKVALMRDIAGVRRKIVELRQVLANRRRAMTIREVKYRLTAAHVEVAGARQLLMRRKAGFRQDQPRWSAGNGDVSGRWSGGPGTGTPFINDAPTGFSDIDDTTETLGRTLARVIDSLPKGRGPLYGIAVHTAFGLAVRLGNIRGIGFFDVETTWGGVDLRYGSLGSVRTDVVLRNDIGDPIAIYDVKTGGAQLTPSRADRLRQAVAPGSNLPVIELHLERGASLKATLANRIFYVAATLHKFMGEQ